MTVGAPSSATSTNTSGTNQASAQLTQNYNTFLQMLTTQLKNQDPMNPTDSNQFVSQLTSYSQLEQLINIHKDTTSLVIHAPPEGR